MNLEDITLKKVIDFYKKHEVLYQLQRNIMLNDKYKNKRCFILGNGPSLKNQDLSKLQDEIVFTVNELPKYDKFKDLKSNYHVWADSTFFNLDLEKEEDIEIFNNMKKVNTNDNKPECFIPIQAIDFIKKNQLDKELEISYYQIQGVIQNYYDSKIKLSQSIPNFATVVQYAICIAIGMGFSEIYLLGCDCTGFLELATYKVEKYEEVGIDKWHAYEQSDKQKQRLYQVYEREPVELTLREWHRVFINYEYLYAYTVKQNIKLVNCTEGGLLDSLPRMKLEEVIYNRN